MQIKKITEIATSLVKQIDELTRTEFEKKIPYKHQGFSVGVQRTSTHPFKFGCEKCGATYTSENPLTPCPKCGCSEFIDIRWLQKIKPSMYFISTHSEGISFFFLFNRHVNNRAEEPYPSEYSFDYIVRDEKGEVAIFSDNNKKVKNINVYYADFEKSNMLHLNNGALLSGFSPDCNFPKLLIQKLFELKNDHCFRMDLTALKAVNVEESCITTRFEWNGHIKHFERKLSEDKDYPCLYSVVSEYPLTYSCGKCGARYITPHQPEPGNSLCYVERYFTCEKCNTHNTHTILPRINQTPFYYCQAKVEADKLLILFTRYTPYWSDSKLHCEEGDKVLVCFDSDFNVYYKNYTVRGWEYTSPHDALFVHQTTCVIDEEDIEIINSFGPISRTGWLEYSKEKGSEKLFEYLNLYSIYKDIEKFSKMKMISVVDVLLNKNNGKLDTVPAKLRPKKPIKLSKNSINQLRKDIAIHTDLDDLMDVLGRDDTATYEDFQYLQTVYRLVKDILRIKIPGMTLGKIAEYLRYVDDYQCCPPREAAQLWNDYLRMMVVLEADMTDRRTVYTNSLKREHDKAARRAGLIKNKKEMEKFNEVIKNEKYTKLAYADEDYTVMLPASASDLLEEGRKLNHCVGSYISRVAHGQTKILFIRETNKPDIPLCTMEVRDDEIIQVRGFSNHAPSNKVQLFVNRYAKKFDLAANYY